VYCKPDIALLDDPLSAVDVNVGRHIFNECIKTELKDKTVILVTHHIEYLHLADYVVFMKDGSIAE
jgi:ATP-binding cassette subfamily C (CFTR/MRP) protein 5